MNIIVDLIGDWCLFGIVICIFDKLVIRVKVLFDVFV